MYAHRVEILYRSYDYNVVVLIAQKLQFILFPAHQRLVYQHLVYRRSLEPPLQQVFEFFPVVHQRSPRTAERERRTYAQRETELLRYLLALEVRTCDTARGRTYAYLVHQLTELFAVLCYVYRIYIDSYQFYPVFFPNALFLRLDSQVERSLSAHCRQYSVYLVLLEYLFDGFHGQRQQVNVVRRYRVGHNGSWVRVDKGHFYTLFAQRTRSLASGIVELGSLAYHYRAAAYYQH